MRGAGWLWVGILSCLPAARAQDDAAKPDDDTTVRPLVRSILRKLHAHMGRRPARNDPGFAAWEEEYEYQRKRAVRKLLVTVRFHGPNGEGKRLDIGPGIEALLSPMLATKDDEKTWSIAGEVVRLDPDSPAGWGALRGLYDGMRARPKPDWSKLHRWARSLRGTKGIRGEAALAVELLVAHVAYELGDRQGARRGAETAVAGGSESDELNRDARRLRSRASLLTLGREAPGFRIAALDGDGEVRLDDSRGRCVLVHFWHVDDPVPAYETITRECATNLSKSELVVLAVPVYDGPEPPKDIAARAAVLAGRVAAGDHVAQDAARAYGVEGISALFLVSPDGQVIRSDRWRAKNAVETVRSLVRQAAGPPVEERLKLVRSWPACRALWHDLVARRQTRFADTTWTAAESLGPRALVALLLASAHGAEDEPPRAAKTKDVHGRLVAAWLRMRRKQDGAAWAEAIAPLSKPKSDECLAVVDAIYDLGLSGDRVRTQLERVANRSRRWETVSMALRAIHFSDTTDSPRSLRRHQRDKRWQVRLALADALRAYRDKDAVDLLIHLLGDKRRRVRARAADHLELLTNVALGPSQKQWTKWRRQQGADLRLRPREVSVYRPFRPPERKYAHKDYYGLNIASDRVVFVLDKSDSMYYGLFDGVVDEMRAHLSSAGPTTKFTVVEFAAKPQAWSKELVPANPANIEAAVSFLHRATPYGPTNIIDALRTALLTPEVDAVVLLSDGLPNKGTPSKPNEILGAVSRNNRYARVAIHAVQLLEGRVFPHDGPRGKEVPPPDDAERARREKLRAWAPTSDLGAFLHSLALRNDGTYGVGFADSWEPAAGTKFRPNTDDG